MASNGSTTANGSGNSAAQLLSRLDADQRAAVTAPVGPVVVLAGAGSGKTRVLTSRVAYRILSGSAEPRHAVAFTFTRQAAAELRNRLGLLGAGRGVTAGTFHGVAYRILRERWQDRGRKDLPLLAANRIEPLTEMLDGDRRLAAIATTEIEWARARLVAPADYGAAAQKSGRRPSAPIERVAGVYSAFETHKRKRRILDFDDLLSECIAELARPGVADAVSWWYRHLHVDEFQDINPLQFAFLEALRNGHDDLFVVGDPAQAIYGWNGADPELLNKVQQGPLRPISITLNTNYRSTPEIVRAGDAVLAHNGSDRSHRADRPAGPPLTVIECDDDTDEARRVVEMATRLRAPGGAWSTIAVLGRTHELLRRLADTFARAGIPTRLVTRRGAAGPDRSDSLPSARTARSAEELHAWAVDLSWPSGEEPAALEDLELAAEATDDPPNRNELERARSTLATVREFEESGGGGANAFAAWRELNGTDTDERGDAVELVTIHAAKGREWPTVIVTGVDSVGFPAPGNRRSPARAEEARLLYVALTRAEDRLVVTWSRKRNASRATRSPLLPELDTQMPERVAPPSMPTRTRAPSATDPVSARRERLRVWRSAAARAAGTPPEFVLSDAALNAIAAQCPTSEAALASVEGVGAMLARRIAGRVLPLLSGPEDPPAAD